MWINVLRPRPRPFKFGWVSISLSYAKNFGFLSRLFCPAFFPVTWSYVINIFCMCLCTHGFIMVHRSRAFHAVWSTAHSWQTRWRPFLFSIVYGVMYQEAEFATNIQTGKDLQRFQGKSTQTSKQELFKDYLQLLVMKFVYYIHLTSYLISQ